MRFVIFAFGFAISAAAFFVRPMPASAALTICNRTDVVIRVAVAWDLCRNGYADSCTYGSRGWWAIEPQACATPISGALMTTGIPSYYYYAEGRDGEVWKGDGSASADYCVAQQDTFYLTDIRDVLPNFQTGDCSNGFQSRNFRQVPVEQENWTENIESPP